LQILSFYMFLVTVLQKVSYSGGYSVTNYLLFDRQTHTEVWFCHLPHFISVSGRVLTAVTAQLASYRSHYHA